MRVLMLHAPYRLPGGEDVSSRHEADLLRAGGHAVRLIERRADGADAWTLGVEAVGMSTEVYGIVTREIEEFQPDVVHCQNLFPRWGPGALHAIRDSGVACVAAVRNYRTFCPAGTMWRAGSPCMDCVTRPWSATVHACWRNSRAQSAVATLAMLRHDWHGVHFVAVSHFVKMALVTAGVATEDAISVKPNCVPGGDPGPGDGGFALFVGNDDRPEKGLDLLMLAWRLAERDMRGIRLMAVSGLAREDVLELMGRAAFVVVPSVWPEPFGRVVIEAYSRRTPVLATAVGGLAELIDDGKTGWLATADPLDLADVLKRAAIEAPQLRTAAYEAWQERFTPERNHDLLMAIYRKAIGRSADKCAAAQTSGNKIVEVRSL